MNKEKLDYQKYSKYNRDQIIAKLKDTLKDKRFQHCLRVEDTAIDLAKRFDVDPTLAGLSGLVHDYAKQRPDSEFIDIIKSHHLNPELLNYGRSIWHGYVGYLIVESELGIHDNRILNAIKYHTIGSPYMDKIAQITYMADYIEPGREFDGVDEARKITRQNLWNGVKYQTKSTISYLANNGKAIYPGAISTFNVIVAGK